MEGAGSNAAPAPSSRSLCAVARPRVICPRPYHVTPVNTDPSVVTHGGAETCTAERARTQRRVVVEVVRSIRERVKSGESPIGAHLKQETLAREYDVSRMPIRQALERLKTEGLVEISPHRGAFVRGPSPHEIREAYLVRAELEGLAAARAAEFVTQSQLTRRRCAERLFEQAIERLTREFARASKRSQTPSRRTDAREWGEANDVFHEVLLEAACNDAKAARRGGFGTATHRCGPRPTRTNGSVGSTSSISRSRTWLSSTLSPPM